MVIINDFGFLTWSMHKYAHTPYKLNYIITWPICFSQWIFILSSPPANHKIDIYNTKTILRAWNRHSIYWYWVCTFLRQELLIGLNLSYSKWYFRKLCITWFDIEIIYVNVYSENVTKFYVLFYTISANLAGQFFPTVLWGCYFVVNT